MSQEKWSAKEAAKAGQKFRREARSIFEGYQKALFVRLEEARLIIRPRPRWMPRTIFGRNPWLWLTDFFVDTSKINTAAMVETPSDYLTRKHHEAVQIKNGHMETVPEGTAAKEAAIEELGDAPTDEDEWEESDDINDLVDGGKEETHHGSGFGENGSAAG